MAPNDIAELRQEQPQSRSISGVFNITIDGVKEPQRCVGCVIEAAVLPLGEHIWNQAIADVVRERSQDVSRFCVTASRECQPFQTDHGVATPIGKPVITGYDGAYLVTRSMRSGGIRNTACGGDEELVGC